MAAGSWVACRIHQLQQWALHSSVTIKGLSQDRFGSQHLHWAREDSLLLPGTAQEKWHQTPEPKSFSDNSVPGADRSYQELHFSEDNRNTSNFSCAELLPAETCPCVTAQTRCGCPRLALPTALAQEGQSLSH